MSSYWFCLWACSSLNKGDTSRTLFINSNLQEIGSVKELLIFHESHLGINVVNEVKGMADHNAQNAAFKIVTAKNPFKQ